MTAVTLRSAGALRTARERTLALVAPLSDALLERQLSPIMSPLAWDLAHIAAYEDLWAVHRFGGLPLLRADLARLYDAFETPRAIRGSLPLLSAVEALDYMAAVRERTLAVLAEGDESFEHELVARHELQHVETMLQALVLARVAGFAPPARAGADPLALVEVAGGAGAIGAGPDGFAYDNERPRHRVELAPYRIGRQLVANGSWREFIERGGYRRRGWWSEDGWAWKRAHAVERPGGWSHDGREWRATGWEPLDPGAPVCHVSCFEAEAFAHSLGARLPTELEWEHAAPTPGGLWEWTASEFRGYPGFVAHPYREYSEVFFDAGFRVLRGGSWATAEQIATATFRNWDLPQRRQIFAGVRLAMDAG